ncbi:type VI secretion system lipoprotein TssJ [Vibrio cholerae]|uniref:type VI secretion system lipoprotein TssJ n=1 Tax=Vibrio cholerae TaxID=666 RepID=UPI0028BBA70F|nr:type VI secretion system lipoprotein TssJ [Vibrio cholerae]EKF9828210.1 type VI secretion system lipoprotein TssJ [Vibrio cholerae]ELJ8466730.1 type VI secretion system lipoprotein TssJ [Vibrio cholerae]HDZ3692057.1 type VI secretion system lipoprotein TssJ [Vibrio cholerae]
MNKVLWMLFALTVLTACSSSDKYEPAKEPTKVTFSLVSDEGVNPNIWGEASPIEIQVFELKDDSMFMSSDYDQIKTDYKKALRSNFVKNYDYVLTPGQFKFVNAFEVDEETNYIGVMAHFAEPELSEWKKAIKVINKGREYHLLMLFKDYDVKLDRVE